MQIPKSIGGIEVFRGDQTHENRVYKLIKTGVFKEFSPGIYTDKKEITTIVNLMYKLYYQILDEYLPKLEPRSFVSFLIAEYENYGRVADAYKRGELTDDDDLFWRSYAMNARRGIKHLLELQCMSNMLSDQANCSLSEQLEAMAMVFIAAEELVSLYIRSDLYTHIFDDVTLTLDPKKHVYFNVLQDSIVAFDPRMGYREIQNFIPEPDYLRDIEAHSLILENGFRQKFGLTYSESLGVLQWLINTYSDEADPRAIGVFQRHQVIKMLTKTFPKLTHADLLLEGFSLSAQSMHLEGRELFRPKQEYRAYKRPFFRDPNDGNDLLFFSRRMANECLTLLISDLAFKKLPPEWRSEKINQALNDISLKAGRWFEGVVKDNLQKIEIVGRTSLKALHFKDGRCVRIPKDVGEIDFLGFCSRQKMLIVIEVKQVGHATEPRMYLDDYSKFIINKNNYSDKFMNKLKWARENHQEIEKYIHENFDATFSIKSIGYAMIVRYPLYISSKIVRFTCMSLPEFMNEYKFSGRQWTFSKVDLNARDNQAT